MSKFIEDNKNKIHRRAFFGALLAKAAEPIANAVGQRVERIEQLAGRPAAMAPPPVLRPPGALKEADFLKACQRSGECIRACPVKAIRPLIHRDPNLRMTPYLMPDIQACVLCKELACMAACPSGALASVAREEVRIGLATVHYDLCLRVDGEDCRECIAQCPIGETAIHLDSDGIVEVVADGCTGCGVCAMACPAPTRAIAIVPRR